MGKSKKKKNKIYSILYDNSICCVVLLLVVGVGVLFTGSDLFSVSTTTTTAGGDYTTTTTTDGLMYYQMRLSFVENYNDYGIPDESIYPMDTPMSIHVWDYATSSPIEEILLFFDGSYAYSILDYPADRILIISGYLLWNDTDYACGGEMGFVFAGSRSTTDVYINDLTTLEDKLVIEWVLNGSGDRLEV